MDERAEMPGKGEGLRHTVCTAKPLGPFSLTALTTLDPPEVATGPRRLAPVPRRGMRHSALTLSAPVLGSCLTQRRRGKSVRTRSRSRALDERLSSAAAESETVDEKTGVSSGRRGSELAGTTRQDRQLGDLVVAVETARAHVWSLLLTTGLSQGPLTMRWSLRLGALGVDV